MTLLIHKGSTPPTARVFLALARVAKRHGCTVVHVLHGGVGYLTTLGRPSCAGDDDLALEREVSDDLHALGVVPGHLREEQLLAFRGAVRRDYMLAHGDDPRRFRGVRYVR